MSHVTAAFKIGWNSKQFGLYENTFSFSLYIFGYENMKYTNSSTNYKWSVQYTYFTAIINNTV